MNVDEAIEHMISHSVQTVTEERNAATAPTRDRACSSKWSVNLLWIHIPILSLLTYLCMSEAFDETVEVDAGEEEAEFYALYKTYLLVCGLTMMLPILLVACILCIRVCRRWSPGQLQQITNAAYVFESLLGSGLFCYRFMVDMQSNKTSENNHSGKILLLMSAI